MTRPPSATGGSRQRRTLLDVAIRAGVSAATVDRVLNDRGGVSAEMTLRVLATAREIGLGRLLPSPHLPLLRLDILLIRPDTEYFRRLSDAFADVAATLGHAVVLQQSFLDESVPEAFVKRIRSTASHGVIMHLGCDNADVYRAIDEASAAGKPVITVTADLPGSSCLAHVGIDNTRAGRAAALVVARMVHGPGALLVLRHSAPYRGQTERVAGFVAGIAERRPDLRIAAFLDVQDHPATARRLVTAALAQHRDIVGVYCAGDGRQAVGDALVAVGLSGRAVFVAHELTAASVAMLRQGVLTLVIDQNPEMQAKQAVSVMLHQLGYLRDASPTGVEFSLHTVENIPII